MYIYIELKLPFVYQRYRYCPKKGETTEYEKDDATNRKHIVLILLLNFFLIKA